MDVDLQEIVRQSAQMSKKAVRWAGSGRLLALGLSSLLMTTMSDYSFGKSIQKFECPRCVVASDLRQRSPIEVPNEAIVFLFAGEFAKNPSLWVFDLRNGRVMMVRINDPSGSIGADRILPPETIFALRREASAAWHRPFPKNFNLYFAPGTVCECAIVRGQEMVPFDTFNPSDAKLMSVLDAAIQSVRSAIQH